MRIFGEWGFPASLNSPNIFFLTRLKISSQVSSTFLYLLKFPPKCLSSTKCDWLYLRHRSIVNSKMAYFIGYFSNDVVKTFEIWKKDRCMIDFLYYCFYVVLWQNQNKTQNIILYKNIIEENWKEDWKVFQICFDV